jgi:hypothetical protein
MFQLVVPNELLLPRILWAGWRGRPLYLLEAQPLIRPLSSVLSAILTFLSKHGLARSAFEAPLSVPVHDGYPGDQIFRAYEPHIESGVQTLFGPEDGEYAYSFRKALSDYTQAMLRLTGIVAWLEECGPVEGWSIAGAPSHFFLVYRLSTGREAPASVAPSRGSDLLINLGNLLAVFAGVLVWLSARMRIFVRKEAFLLAIDRISPIDITVAREITQSPSQVLVVERNQALAEEAVPDATCYLRCSRDDARAAPRQALRLSLGLWKDLWTIWQRHGYQDAPLFGRLVSLAGKRVVFAAFFQRFQPRFFWCRDDYSMDHGIRSQELRKVGGKSIGVNHGLPINTYTSHWREIDFDIYFVYGAHLYETFYKRSWPAAMSVRAAGNMQLTPERRKRLQNPRPLDIAIYVTVILLFDEFMEEMLKVARHFSDRRVHFRMKGKRESYYMRSFARWMEAVPPNVTVNMDTDPYNLMLSTSYAIAAGSTAAVEAIGFGAKAFVFDTEPRYRNYYYRNFPGLIVHSGDDLIHRIEAVESGKEHYDPREFETLIAQSGPDIYEQLRQELGWKG